MGDAENLLGKLFSNRMKNCILSFQLVLYGLGLC